MIREALEWMKAYGLPTFKENDGRLFSDRVMMEVKPKKPDAIKIGSLAGFISHCNSYGAPLDVIVENYNCVKSVEFFGSDLRVVAMCEYEYDCDFNLGRHYDQESFCLGVQSLFVQTDELMRLRTIAENIVDETVVTSEDDGVSQSAVVKTGIKRHGKQDIKNPFELDMFRAWPEIESINTPCILRIKKGPLLGLFDHGGDAWKYEIITRLREHLQSGLNSGINVF